MRRTMLVVFAFEQRFSSAFTFVMVSRTPKSCMNPLRPVGPQSYPCSFILAASSRNKVLNKSSAYPPRSVPVRLTIRSVDEESVSQSIALRRVAGQLMNLIAHRVVKPSRHVASDKLDGRHAADFVRIALPERL
ncbi:MAG TPA: hypothetical protein VMB19_12250 [Silvibacterium sp.]|nr:hypothetical protein [Silvibacterium sp.]